MGKLQSCCGYQSEGSYIIGNILKFMFNPGINLDSFSKPYLMIFIYPHSLWNSTATEDLVLPAESLSAISTNGFEQGDKTGWQHIVVTHGDIDR